MTHEEKVEAGLAQQTALLLRAIYLLEHQKPAPQSPDRIRLPVTNGQGQIYFRHEIILLSGDGNYTHVNVERDKQHKKLTLCHNLGYWEEVFNDFHFLRLHDSYILNPDFIKDFTGRSYHIELPYELSFTVTPPYRQLLNFYFHCVH